MWDAHKDMAVATAGAIVAAALSWGVNRAGTHRDPPPGTGMTGRDTAVGVSR
jgi:hypothetical protein